jgi:hypothetical protein
MIISPRRQMSRVAIRRNHRHDRARLIGAAPVHGLEKARLGVEHADHGELLSLDRNLFADRIGIAEQARLERVVDDHHLCTGVVLRLRKAPSRRNVGDVCLEPVGALRVVADVRQVPVFVVEIRLAREPRRGRGYLGQIANTRPLVERDAGIAAFRTGVVGAVARIESDTSPTHLK